MNIQHEIDQFIGAVARLRGVTDYINGLADSVEGLVAENAGIPEPYVNQMPTAAAEYPAPPAPAPAFVPTTADEMIQARDEAVASIAAEAQVPPTVWPAAPASDAVETAPSAQTPWEAQAESAASPAEEPAPAPEKKTGRRTNEELAAEAGVNLADVKKWKGGGRISKADIEEFAKISAATPPPAGPPAAPAQPANPFGGAAVPPQQAPVTPPAQPVTPQAAAVPPQAAPVAPGQGAPQEWPAAGQPVATLPASPNEAYGNWPTVEGGFSASNPFGG